MTFVKIAGDGTGADKSATTTMLIIPTATIPADSLVIVTIASDNTGTTDGAVQDDIASVTDTAGNTYTFASGYRNGQGSAKAGAHVSIFYSVLTTQLTVSSTITVTNTTSGYARAGYLTPFSKGAGTPIIVAATNGAAADGGAEFNFSISSLTSREYLFIAAIAEESPGPIGTSGTADAAFGTWGKTANTSGGASASNQIVTIGHSIETATSKTLNTSDDNTIDADAAATLCAFYEGAAATSIIFNPFPLQHLLVR